jgi:hypothetical protein
MQLYYVWSANIVASFGTDGKTYVTWTDKLWAGRTLIFSFDVREMVSKMWTEDMNLCSSARTIKVPAKTIIFFVYLFLFLPWTVTKFLDINSRTDISNPL